MVQKLFNNLYSSENLDQHFTTRAAHYNHPDNWQRERGQTQMRQESASVPLPVSDSGPHADNFREYLPMNPLCSQIETNDPNRVIY